jgi:hypothetical protein
MHAERRALEREFREDDEVRPVLRLGGLLIRPRSRSVLRARTAFASALSAAWVALSLRIWMLVARHGAIGISRLRFLE